MYYQIDISIKPYVKDYLINQYGNPVFASKDNIVGILVEPFLEKTPDNFIPKASPDNNLSINLSWAGMFRGYKDIRVHNYISPKNSKLLAKALEKIFWNVFYSYMEANTFNPNPVKINAIIINFMNFHNIDPMNGSLDMFTKRFYRKKLFRTYVLKFPIL